jgi:hypothetical protein
VVVKFSQLSCPLTAFALVRTVDFKVAQRLLQPQVSKNLESLVVAGWAVLVALPDGFNTLLTETLPTASGLVGLSEN